MSEALTIQDHSVSFQHAFDTEAFDKVKSATKKQFILACEPILNNEKPSLQKIVEVGHGYGYRASVALKDAMKYHYKGVTAKQKKAVVDAYFGGNHDAMSAMTTAYIADKLANGYTPDGTPQELSNGRRIRIELMSAKTPAQIRAEKAEAENLRIQKEAAAKFDKVKALLNSTALDEETKAALVAVLG